MVSAQQLKDLQRLEKLLKFSWRCQNPAMGLCPTDGRPHPGHPYPHARQDQLFPEDAFIFALISGRGFGKSRSAAEFAKERMLNEPNHRVALISPDFAAGRDILVEGESGLRGLTEDQGCIPWEYIQTWNRSMGELVLTNGSVAKIFGTDSENDAEKIRGFQFHTAIFDELATQNHGQIAFDNAQFALRLGNDPKIMVTTTPRPIPIIQKLIADSKKPNSDTVVRGGSTYDNAANLPERTIIRLKERYEGTTLGKQELFGEVLNMAVGALWKPEHIVRADCPFEDVTKIVVSVDPAGSHKLTSDETGIVVVAYVPEWINEETLIQTPSRAYVLADYTDRYTPEEWSAKVVNLYHEYSASAVVAETNYGGALVTSTIKSTDKSVHIQDVKARVGKAVRAEPVVGLYEQRRVFHSADLPELEDELLSWVPPGRFDPDGNPIKPSKKSPNRLDALVWAIYALSLNPRQKRGRLQFHR